MPTQTFVPDTVVSTSNMTGATVANLSADDGNWALVTFDGAAGFVRVGFPMPPLPLVSGADIQTFNAKVRRNNSSAASDPTARLELWQTGGALLAQGPDVVINNLANQTISLNWDAALLAAISGEDVEALVRFTFATGGAGGSKTVAVDIGYIEWLATFANQRKAARCSYIL